MEEALASSPTNKPPLVSLAPALLVWRGDAQSERVTVTVLNTGESESDYTLEVDGLDRSWYTVTSQIRIAAGQSFQTGLSLHPPSGLRPGDYPFRVIVTMAADSGVAGEAAGWISVPATVASQSQAVPQPRQSQPPPAADLVTPPDVLLAPRTAFRFGPGEVSAQAMVTVHNRGKIAERYKIWIDGLPDNWHALSSEEVRLEPGANSQVPLRLTPRTGAGMPAGDYEFRIRAAPQSLPESYGEAVGLISITGVSTFDARIRPVQAEGRKRPYTLTVMNTGDLPLVFDVQASDPEARCRFRVPSTRELEPGQEVHLQIPVGAKRLGVVGPQETFDFHIKVVPAGGAPSSVRTFDARFLHKPLIGFRLPFIGAFLLFLAVVTIGIVFLAKPYVGDAITWAGCQMDSTYRFSINSGSYVKPQCKGGRPYQNEFDDWQRQQQSSTRRSQETGLQLTPGGALLPLHDASRQVMAAPTTVTRGLHG